MTMQTEIGEWAQRNFAGKFGPQLGVVEEIGEASHCLLKRRQGIRGFDNIEHFKAQLADALADCGVYALHSAYITGSTIGEIEFDRDELLLGQDSDEAWVGGLSVLGASLCAQATGMAHPDLASQNLYGNLFGALEALGDKHGIDFPALLEATWNKVKQRDWVKNPKNAHEVAENNARNPDGTEYKGTPCEVPQQQA